MQDNSCVLERFQSLESGPLANLLACEGKPGKVCLSLVSLPDRIAVSLLFKESSTVPTVFVC